MIIFFLPRNMVAKTTNN